MLNLQVVFITAVLVAISLQSRNRTLPRSRSRVVNNFMGMFEFLKGEDGLLTLDEALNLPSSSREDYLTDPNTGARYEEANTLYFKNCMFNEITRDNTIDGADRQANFEIADANKDNQVTRTEYRRFARAVYRSARNCYRERCIV